MRTLGIDVSHWEGNIDWIQAAPTIGFAYFKCTEGVKFIDPQFNVNRQGCQKAGLAHAPYHFFQPALDPNAQAEFFIRTAGKGYSRYIVDVEVTERQEKITQKLLDFLQRVTQLTGARPAIYTSPGYWNEYIQPHPKWADDYELIVAHYTVARTPTLPAGWNNWRIWQFSDDWYFRGCSECADADWFNGSFEECQAWFGNAAPSNLKIAESGFRLRSLFDNLHIRQYPNMNAKVVGSLARGEVVESEELSGDDVWVRHAQGWSAIERGGYRYMEIIK
jgi:lysozyme